MNTHDLSYLSKKLLPGRTYLIKEGEYTSGRINIKSSGTKEKPITITSEGLVRITGKTIIDIKGSYIILSGFEFTDLESNKAIKITGDNNRFTKNIIEELRTNVEQVVRILGSHNRIDNNNFRRMRMKGVIVCVEVGPKNPSYTLIDNNNFSDRFGIDGETNGLEMIRVGDSKTSLNSSKSLIYNNTFSNCDGEIEIISIKSCDNIVSNNKIIGCKGTITLRHGNNNLVTKNYINGTNKEGCGGIRVIGNNHKIIFNTLENLTEEEPLRCPISVMNGQESPKINGYQKVNNLEVKYNDFINCFSVFAIGVNNKRGKQLKPDLLTITNNRIIKCNYLYSKSKKAHGYLEATITNNSFVKYDQKLNLYKGMNNEDVDIEKLYLGESQYHNVKEPVTIQESESESEEKYPDEKPDINPIFLRKECDVVILDKEEEPKPDLSPYREALKELYEANLRKTAAVKALLDLL